MIFEQRFLSNVFPRNMEISLENLYVNIGIERVNKKTIQGGNKKISSMLLAEEGIN